jgi:ABC-type iron transport system FetAB permease component
LTTMIMEGGRREVELCLSFGASGLESIKRLMKDAVSVGVTPMINQLNVIGLVSIPGELNNTRSTLDLYHFYELASQTV